MKIMYGLEGSMDYGGYGLQGSRLYVPLREKIEHSYQQRLFHSYAII